MGCSKMMRVKIFLWLAVVVTRAVESVGEGVGEKEEVISRLEKSLLATFGLDERPKVDKSQVKVPPYMMHLYNQKVKENIEETEQEEEEREEKSRRAAASSSPGILPNTVRSFTHAESVDDRFHLVHQMLLRFNVSSVPQREVLREAEVRVMHLQHPSIPAGEGKPIRQKRRWSKNEITYLQRLRVYDVLRPARGALPPMYRLLDSRIIDARVNDTARLDVAATIKRWLNKPHTNHGLFVEVVPIAGNTSSSPSPFSNTAHVRLRRSASTDPDHPEWTAQQPLLVVHTDDPNIKPRKRRNSPPSRLKNFQSNCQIYNLYVNFKKVDWSTWIVAPQGYDAYFCQGTCPFPLAKHMNATNHAVIQNIIHSKYPNRVPSACCVPINYAAMSMLYLDKDGRVVLKNYQDMIVTSCGCQ